MAIKKACIQFDTGLIALQAWIDANTVTTIEGITTVGNFMVILYT